MIISKAKLEERLDQVSDILRDDVFSDENDTEIDLIIRNLNLTEEQHIKVSRSCLYVFLGFLRIKDLFEELVQEVKLDSKTALVVFQALDQKIFSNHRAQIEANYKNFQTGANVAQEDIEPLKTQEQVLLRKETSPETVDLSLKDIPIETQNSKLKTQNNNKQQTNTNTLNLGQQFSGAAPVSMGGGIAVADSKIPKQPPETNTKPPLVANHSSPPASDGGPVIIHKVEEAQSVGQLNAVKGYKQMSFGSFMGSFSTPQSKTANISRAEVEIPGATKPQSAAPQQQNTQPQSTAQQVPFSVKKYEDQNMLKAEEQAKVVHYTFDEGRQK